MANQPVGDKSEILPRLVMYRRRVPACCTRFLEVTAEWQSAVVAASGGAVREITCQDRERAMRASVRERTDDADEPNVERTAFLSARYWSLFDMVLPRIRQFLVHRTVRGRCSLCEVECVRIIGC